MADDEITQMRRVKLRMSLEELRNMKGFGTELVTLIIPPDRQVSDARQMLQNEHGQAANIKSKGTRKKCTRCHRVSSFNTSEIQRCRRKWFGYFCRFSYHWQ